MIEMNELDKNKTTGSVTELGKAMCFTVICIDERTAVERATDDEQQ